MNAPSSSAPVLAPAPARKRLHTRSVLCDGYQREDGLWDIEASLRDVKTTDSFDADGSLRLPAGEPLHQMGLRITVDDEMCIVAAEAFTERAPHRECPQIGRAYAELVGMRVGPGFIATAKKMFRGSQGCTHLTELLGPLATTTFQTLWPVLDRRQREQFEHDALTGQIRRPALIDSCHALRGGGDVVKRRWPVFFSATDESPPR